MAIASIAGPCVHDMLDATAHAVVPRPATTPVPSASGRFASSCLAVSARNAHAVAVTTTADRVAGHKGGIGTSTGARSGRFVPDISVSTMGTPLNQKNGATVSAVPGGY